MLAVVAVALVGLVVSATIRSAPGTPRGLTARGDAHRTGQVTLDELAAPTEVAWTTSLDVEPTTADPDRVVAAGDAVVVTARNTRITGFDTSSGLVRWTTDLGNGIAGVRGVAVAGSTVAVSSLAADLAGRELPNVIVSHLLDATTGEVLSTDTAVQPPYPLTFPGVVPVLGFDDRLMRVDVRTVRSGTLRDGEYVQDWATDLTSSRDASVVGLVASTPSTVVVLASQPAGVVLQSNVAGGNALLVALDVRDGSVRWSSVFPSSMPFTGIAATDDAIAAMAGDGQVRVLDLASGRIVHELVQPNRVTGLALAGDELVLGTDQGRVVGFDLTSGTPNVAIPVRTGSTPGLRVHALPDGGFLVHDRDQPAEAVLLARVAESLGPAGTIPLDAALAVGGGPGLFVLDDGTDVLALDSSGTSRWRAPLPERAVLGLATDGTNVTVQAPDGTAVVDGRTGERLASIRRGFGRVPADRQGGPVVTDGTTTVTSPLSFDGARPGLVALGAATGIVQWSREGDAPTAEGPMTLAGDRVWLPVSDEVHGYELADGRRAYAARAGIPRGPLAVTSELILAPAAATATDEPTTLEDQAGPANREPNLNAALLALGRESRRPVWSADTGGCGVLTVVGDLVVVPTPVGVVARDLVTGAVIWTQPATRGSCVPLTAADGRIVHSRGRTLTALDVGTGEVAWTESLARVPVTPPVATADEVVVSDAAGTLQALSLRDGAPRWQFGLPTRLAAPPLVVEGRLVGLLMDGRILALR